MIGEEIRRKQKYCILVLILNYLFFFQIFHIYLGQTYTFRVNCRDLLGRAAPPVAAGEKYCTAINDLRHLRLELHALGRGGQHP